MVLAGAKRCAALQKTRFLVEMHSNAELSMAENANRILAWCAEQKYRGWYLSEGTPLHSSEDVKTRGRCHLLLQPAGWPYPSWLEGIPQSAGLESVWSRASQPKVSSSEE
jgi:hypothetical protein